MARELYEALGVDSRATEEQIKKAYRKRALQTHPDRLPQNASASEKERATEEFRRVNNAYEVLSDPSKRREYDRTGVWPPRDAPAAGPSYNGPFAGPSFGSPFGDPFGGRSDPFSHPFFSPGFTDPFRIFESFFGSRAFPSAFDHVDPGFDEFARRPRGFARPRQPSFDPFSPFGMLSSMPFGGGMFGDGAFDSGFPGASRGGTRVYSSSTHAMHAPGQGWVSESRSMRTINGVTESIWKRTDNNGNEYVTYTHGDGTQRHTLNGAEHDGNTEPRYITQNASTAQDYAPSSRHAQYAAPPPPRVHHATHPPPPLPPSHTRPDERRFYDDDAPVIPPPPGMPPGSYPSRSHRKHRY